MSNKVLILSKPGDTTGQAIAATLHISGHEPNLYYGASFPTRDEHTLSIDGKVTFTSRTTPNLFPDEGFASVWVRRPDTPWIPPEIIMEADDRLYVETLLDVYSSSLMSLQIDSYGRNAFWVNPMFGRLAASSKPLQLKLASKYGLLCPPTIITNDPDSVRRFRSEKGPLICKALVMGTWSSGRGMAVSYTSLLDDVTRLPDDSIRIQPSIYQPCISKKYEVRAVIFGHRCFAIRIDSQMTDNSKIDSRGEYWTSKNTSPYKLPDAIIQKCQMMMSHLGIVYGAFDFIVSEDDEIIFLEVNEAGQCLFMEDIHPEMPILSALSHFVRWGDLSNWSEYNGPLLSEIERTDTFLSIREEAQQWVASPVL